MFSDDLETLEDQLQLQDEQEKFQETIASLDRSSSAAPPRRWSAARATSSFKLGDSAAVDFGGGQDDFGDGFEGGPLPGTKGWRDMFPDNRTMRDLDGFLETPMGFMPYHGSKMRSDFYVKDGEGNMYYTAEGLTNQSYGPNIAELQWQHRPAKGPFYATTQFQPKYPMVPANKFRKA
eukprot:gnl/TRDRNA2_/TRDRNA2_181331_c0_seq1.p1 gnl/TRDRNA2_/TRDRNA2_181331_c0~~gnl/TRDRNA2_/TRDRNA2_181331_c0_seq1.p1  ORF type:complete len:192 (-),score=44.51 gnl/TRDRNA2_/TRDRNA2_181331_c0_seq1:86-619(-)